MSADHDLLYAIQDVTNAIRNHEAATKSASARQTAAILTLAEMMYEHDDSDLPPVDIYNEWLDYLEHDGRP